MYLFKQTDAEDIYEPLRNVQRGLGPRIWELMKNKAEENPPPEGQGFPWQMDRTELVRSCLGDSETGQDHRYKLVADVQNVLANSSRMSAQLFEACEVFGLSGWSWTPMMWKLRLLLEVDDCTEARSQRRWKFSPADYFVCEFLRLQADHNWEHSGEGRRDFGMVGKFNGVLLWPEALKYFIEKIESG